MRIKLKRISNLKILAKIITSIPVSLLLFIIGTIIYIFVTRYKNVIVNIDESSSNFTVAVISAIVELVFVCGVTAIPKFREFLINLWYSTENRIYIFINNKFSNIFIKKYFINIYNTRRLIPYTSQNKVINTFLNNIKLNENNFFYITGDNDSGKTTMLLLLFDECANKHIYYKTLNKKAIYLCKSYNNNQIQSFINNYLIGKFEGRYIIIDDVGDFSHITQIKLWNKIILPIIESNICYAKCITIISDKNNSFINTRINNGDKNENVYIIEKSKSKDHYLKWQNESQKVFKKYNIKNAYMKSIINEAIKQVGANTIELLFDYSLSSLKVLFICFIVLSRYSKIVDSRIAKKLYKKLGYNTWDYYKNLYTLINSNLLIVFPFINNFFYIDNQVTSFCLQIYRKLNIYSKILELLKTYCEFINDAEKWLVHCENCLLLNERYSEDLFIKAFNMGNYKYLLDNLNNILLVTPTKKLKFYKELGYLNEKVGNRELAS